MLKFVVQFILIYLFWRNNAKAKKGWLNPSSILLGIYVISSFFSIGTLYMVDYTYPFYSRYWWPMFEFLAVICLFLLPFRLFKENNVKSIILPNKVFMDIASTILILLSIYSIFFYAVVVKSIFSQYDLGEARTNLYLGTEYVESGISNTIASVSASLYVFDLLFFFMYSTMRNNKMRCILLLISSLSEPLHILSFVGRDGIVFWFLSFIFLYSLFRPYLSEQFAKTLQKYFFIMVSILIIPFLAITLSRFSTSKIGVEGQTVRYMGESFINGPLFFGIDNPPYTAGKSFPLYYEILGKKLPDSIGRIQIDDWKSWTFSTFVVGFYINLGFHGMMALCLFLFIVFRLVVHSKDSTMYLYSIIVYILYFQIYSEGVFYFRQYTRGGNLFIILCVIFAVIVYMERNNNGIRIEKK